MVKKVVSKKPKKSLLGRAEAVTKKAKGNLRMLVYGAADTGKTEFASTWPTPILFIGFKEEGMDTIHNKKNIQILELENWQEFEDLYYELEGGTEFKTIVLDQITSLQGFAQDSIREKMKKKPGEIFSQKNWGQLSGLMKTWIENYRNLTNHYNVVFLAHERPFDTGDEDEESDNPTRIGAAIIPSVHRFLSGAVSAIGHTFIQEDWVKDKKTKKETRVVEFCMRVGPSELYYTKIRRPVKWGAIPEYIVNPTYQKVIDIIHGES